MTSLAEKESDSSDEDWVFESVDVTPSTRLGLHKRQPKLKISSGAIRTIRNCLPKQQQPTIKPPIVVKQPPIVIRKPAPSPPPSSQAPQTVAQAEKKLALAENVPPSIDYLTHEELEKMCIDMDADALVFRLIKVYKSTEIFIRIREIESQNMTIESRLRDVLAECSDPCNFILVSQHENIYIYIYIYIYKEKKEALFIHCDFFFNLI
jgi:hypothetical protein